MAQTAVLFQQSDASVIFASPNDCKTDIITGVKIIHFEKCWYEQKPSVWDDRWKWW